jgi:anti-sigma regulatory factor (Ser/Thr protein kinase)
VLIDRSIELAADRTSPAAARRFVEAEVGGAVDDFDALLLCVTELVSNAVLHARSRCRVRVRSTSESVRVEVWDSAPDHLPEPKRYDPHAVTGRGLYLVDTLTTAWGVDVAVDGKTVWFELDRRPAA